MQPNMNNYGYHCWITNVTKTKLILSDLKRTIDPGKTIDLLDFKGSRLTIAQIEKSIESGSLGYFYGKKFIRVRQGQPQKIDPKKIEVSKLTFPYKVRTMIQIEQQKFKELEFDSYELNKLSNLDIEENDLAINLQEAQDNVSEDDDLPENSGNNEE